MYFRPLTAQLRKLIGHPLPDLTAVASDRWQVSPGDVRPVPPAICLPGQLDRIRATEFVPIAAVIRAFRGGFDAVQNPTMAYLLRDVDLVDGVLYARGGQRHLQARSRRRLVYRVPQEVMQGALYESWVGNRWFGNWLSDDCLTYRLAEAAGEPVTSMPMRGGHVPRYEALLGMQPRRASQVHFSALTLFDDLPDNEGKAARARDLRQRLTAGRLLTAVPGVFLLRGATGDRRLLENETAIAALLAETRGFQVVDPSTATVDELVGLCGAARVIAGVEGSHLVHGLAAMPPEAALLVIQPPDRVVAALKTVTDRQSQRYAFVVAEGNAESFRVCWDEVRRTLDLLD